jgi:hypothetical protein
MIRAGKGLIPASDIVCMRFLPGYLYIQFTTRIACCQQLIARQAGDKPNRCKHADESKKISEKPVNPGFFFHCRSPPMSDDSIP